MRINWGLGITLVMIGFVSFMGMLTYKCFQTPSFLVRDDYYEAGLTTDDAIASSRRGTSLPKLEARPEEDRLVISNLRPAYDALTRVSIDAYFPSDPELDWQWAGLPEFSIQGDFSVTLPQKYVTYPTGKYQVTWVHLGQVCTQILDLNSHYLMSDKPMTNTIKPSDNR